ncbi:GcrA cell cycle regulator [Micrococcales bacterium KH10]|nr:GcrA cell cycle regulator [Micrococcales bacterium KH10]
MAARPWTPDEDQKLRNLHANEISVRRIAETLGRPRSTVASRIRRLGLKSTRTKTLAATQANMADAKSRRAKAALAELEILELSQTRALKTLRDAEPWQTVLRGEMGIEEPKDVGFVPPRDMREESSARASMAATVDRLTIEDNGAAAAASMLERLAGAIGIPNLETDDQ